MNKTKTPIKNLIKGWAQPKFLILKGALIALGLIATTIVFSITEDIIKSHTQIDINSLPVSTNIDNDRFGNAIEAIGDINGDGTTDIVIGAKLADSNVIIDGEPISIANSGAIWLNIMDPDNPGVVLEAYKIPDDVTLQTGPNNLKLEDPLTTGLDTLDLFGESIALLNGPGLTDLDGDTSTIEIAVRAGGDDTTETGPGAFDNKAAIWILSIGYNAATTPKVTVTPLRKIQQEDLTPHGITLTPSPGLTNPGAIENVGDVNGDGIVDLAFADMPDMTKDIGLRGGNKVHILLLNPNTPTALNDDLIGAHTIDGIADLGGTDGDMFGTSIACLGDLDGNGIEDIAISSVRFDDPNGSFTLDGKVLLLDFTVNGGIMVSQQLTLFQTNTDNDAIPTTGDTGSFFGFSVEGMGDLDNNGTPDVAIGQVVDIGHDGAIRIVFLEETAGTVSILETEFIRKGENGFCDPTTDCDKTIIDDPGSPRFGASLANLGDIDGNGVTDLAVGQTFQMNNVAAQGGVWVLKLNEAAFPLERSITDLPDFIDPDGDPDTNDGAIPTDNALQLLLLPEQGLGQNQTLDQTFTAKNNDDTIAIWPDLSGFRNHALQNSPDAQPIYKDVPNTHSIPAVEFNPTGATPNHGLTIPNLNISEFNEYTIFIVAYGWCCPYVGLFT